MFGRVRNSSLIEKSLLSVLISNETFFRGGEEPLIEMSDQKPQEFFKTMESEKTCFFEDFFNDSV